MSLHQVQDFYTHTNWVEPGAALGGRRPGLAGNAARHQPDVVRRPADRRDAATIYTANTPGPSPPARRLEQRHATANLQRHEQGLAGPAALPARSAISAYFATRQWVEAVRLVGRRRRLLAARAALSRATSGDLDHDLRGSVHHLAVQRPLAGSGRAARRRARRRREPARPALRRSRTTSRAALATSDAARPDEVPRPVRAADPADGGSRTATARSARCRPARTCSADTRIVALRIVEYRGTGLGDPGPDDADMYARVRIDGQPMASAVHPRRGHFAFPHPYEPFTWIKAVPAVPDEGEPVESIEVDVKTADTSLGGDRRRRLPAARTPACDSRSTSALYDDFERGDRDTYSVPIDAAAEHGLRVGDITGADREVARRHRRRLEARRREAAGERPRSLRQRSASTAGSRTTTAPGPRRTSPPRDPRGAHIPVSAALGEDDTLTEATTTATSTRTAAGATLRSATLPGPVLSGGRPGRQHVRRAAGRRRRGGDRLPSTRSRPS